MNPKLTYRFTVATACATFVLLLIGGLVNPTGSSLACPDWPLCHGTAFPEMTGGVLFEHSHRLAATTVGIMNVVLALLLWRQGLGKLGLIAVGLVVLQGVLGGLTVLLKLPPEISIGHLALSMIVFVFTIYVAAVTRRQVHEPRPAVVSATLRRWILFATGLAYAQIVLGAVVRHTHAAMACLNEIPLCFGQIFPLNAPYTAQLHMAHRLLGVLVALAVIAVGARVAVQVKSGAARWLGIAAPVLVVGQIVLGIYTVLTMKALDVVEAHLGVGVLLFADLILLSLATRGTEVAVRVPASARSLEQEQPRGLARP